MIRPYDTVTGETKMSLMEEIYTQAVEYPRDKEYDGIYADDDIED